MLNVNETLAAALDATIIFETDLDVRTLAAQVIEELKSRGVELRVIVDEPSA